MKLKLLLQFVFMMAAGMSISQTIYYVDQGASGLQNGLSWDDAYINLQIAINQSNDGDEIWVKSGTYFPVFDVNGDTNSSDPRMKTFYIDNKSIEIYGGFAGFETSKEDRDIISNPTILSGDIGVTFNASDNAYTVLRIYNNQTEVDDVVVDGLTFIDANYNGVNQNLGGALRMFSTAQTSQMINLTVENCTFINNTSLRGAAMNVLAGTLKCTNNTFINNSVSSSQGHGGAIFRKNSVETIIERCHFQNNFAQYGGGIKFENCNSSYLVSENRVENCIFEKNTGQYGTTIQAFDSDFGVNNCTFFKNNGPTFSFFDNLEFRFSNSIVFSTHSNHVQQLGNTTLSSLKFNNNIISGGYANGTNIFDVDPQFKDTLNTFELLGCSPAIDAGINDSLSDLNGVDFNLLDRVNNGTVDMGAAEYYKPQLLITSNDLSIGFPMGATYQWLDCNDNYETISGENTDIYSPLNIGYYAVEITYLGCVDTSDCGAFCNAFTPTVSLNGNTLSVTPIPNATYQWVDCDNGNVAGATSETFSPQTSGDYAVEVTEAGVCQNISNCVSVTIANSSTIDDAQRNHISIYPNPTRGKLTINGLTSFKFIEVYNTLGKKMKVQSTPLTNGVELSLEHLTPGVYFISIMNEDDEIKTEKIILKKF